MKLFLRTQSRNILFWILIACSLLGLIKQFISYADYVDSKEYIRAAENFLDHRDFYCGELFTKNDFDLTKRTPAYPILLLIFLLKPMLVLLFQNILFLISLYWFQKILHTLNLMSKQIWNCALLLYISHPLFFIYSNMICTESMVLSLITIIMYSIVVKKYKYLFVYFLFLLALKPLFTVLLLIVLLSLAILSLFYFRQEKIYSGLIRVGGHMIPAYLFLILISFWNQRRTGVFHYSSISITNTYYYNAFGAMQRAIGQENALNNFMQFEEKMKSMEFAEKYQFMKLRTSKIIVKFWKEYLLIHFKGSLAMFLDPGRFDYANFLQKPYKQGFMEAHRGHNLKLNFSTDEWIWIVIFTAINLITLIFFLIGIGKMWKSNFKFLILSILLVLLFNSLIAGPVGSARYLAPFLPLLFLPVLFAMNSLIEKRKKLSSASLSYG